MLPELLETQGSAAKECNELYARHRIKQHLEAIEQLKVYLNQPYETPPCHRCASLRTESVYDRV